MRPYFDLRKVTKSGASADNPQAITVIFISHREAVMASADELLRLE